MKVFLLFIGGFGVLLTPTGGMSTHRAPAQSSLPRPASLVPPLKLPGQTLEQKRKKVAPYENGVPRSPQGLERCHTVLHAGDGRPFPLEETIRYTVDIDGLSVGTIDFKVMNRGFYSGRQVDEYRAVFAVDSFVSTLLPVRGQAASVVELEGHTPLRAMNRYTIEEHHFEEQVEFQPHLGKLIANRARNGKRVKQHRFFNYGVRDFVSAFYYLRRMPRDIDGCMVLYSNQRAYTVWIQKEGEEKIQTPVGYRLADRYRLQYGSEYAKLSKKGHLWIGADELRLPYRVEIHSRHTLEAQIHLYEAGEQK